MGMGRGVWGDGVGEMVVEREGWGDGGGEMGVRRWGWEDGGEEMVVGRWCTVEPCTAILRNLASSAGIVCSVSMKKS